MDPNPRNVLELYSPSNPFHYFQDSVGNQYSGCESVVRTVISLGLLPNMLTLAQHSGGDTIRMSNQDKQELTFHPRSCNRNVMKNFTSLSHFATVVPRLFVYYEKLNSNTVSISDSTACDPFLMCLLAPNVEFEYHEDPTGDVTIDVTSKKHLGVLFENKEGYLI